MDSQTSGNKNIIEIETDKVVFTLKSKNEDKYYPHDLFFNFQSCLDLGLQIFYYNRIFSNY